MNEALVLLKLTAVVLGISVVVLAMMSFIMWRNPFRDIKPMFAVRLFVCLVAYAWMLYFLSGMTK